MENHRFASWIKLSHASVCERHTEVRIGLGRALFTRATQRLVAMGFSSAILWVLVSNAQARRFYEIGGWTCDGGTKLDVRSEGIELKEVSYRIDLRRKHEES
jgi:ribosomal protein S18 acetylase RimI-like enzyme